jgi:hypothetical protein
MFGVDLPPLIITGMHRSGTSATARLLAHAGLDLGADLLAPSLDNTLGYYEDLQFCNLNIELLSAGAAGREELDPSWAFPELLDPTRYAPIVPELAAALAERRATGVPWGFKDPRTAILLDLYAKLVPDARYLFVYRSPWEVLTSLLTTTLRPLQGRADVAVRAWCSYNERILAFCERCPDRTVLVHVDAIGERAAEVIALVNAQAAPGTAGALDAGASAPAFVDQLLRRADANAPLAELIAADHPDATELYARLEERADLASSQPSSQPPPVVDVEVLGGRLAIDAVLVGAPADGLDEVARIARPRRIEPRAEAADTAIELLASAVVAVLFEGQLRDEALPLAMQALEVDPTLGAVLLVPGGVPVPADLCDPAERAFSGAGIVVRREAYLAARGFAFNLTPPGFEGWAFAAACAAHGARIGVIHGGIHRPGPNADDPQIRAAVLTALPSLASARAVSALAAAAAADARAADLERVVSELRAELAPTGPEIATAQTERERATFSQDD